MGDSKTRQLSIICVILAAAGLFALYFAGMGSYPLVDPDEPVYGQIAKEMAAGAGWLTPHYNGSPWFDKPPLFYWLSGGCAKLLGPTELASRLPSAVLAVAVLVLLYFLVKHDFGKRAALISTVVMATCLQTIILARAAVTDMTFTFCLLGALYAYRRWYGGVESGKSKVENSYPLKWMALCGIMTGLGMLAKGPVAPLLLSATFFIHLLWNKQLKRLLSVDVLVAVASALIVGLPWFVAMYMINRHAFVHQFIEVNNLARFAKPEHAKVTGGWYSYFLNIPVLFMFFFPWSVFLPSGILRFRAANDGARLAFVWFAVVFIFFSISKTQLVTYIFPLYPMAALFVGVLLDRAASMDKSCMKTIGRGLIIDIVIALLLAAVLVVMSRANYPEAKSAAIALGAILLLTPLVAYIMRSKSAHIPWIIGTGMVAFTLILILGVVPCILPNVSTREIVRTIPRVANGRVVEWNLRKPSLLFYLGFTPEHLRSISDAKRMLGEQESTWVICKSKEANLLRVDGSIETARMGGFAVIANKTAAAIQESRRN